MVEDCEYLDPRRFNQSVKVVARHMERYIDAAKLLGTTGKGEAWLDFGCGSGYGTSILKHFASTVVGYDPIYKLPLDARTDVPLLGHIPDYKFDAVFCIEVIEHVTKDELPALLEEIKSVANKWIIISTPIIEPGQRVTNPYHKHEYRRDELEAMLKKAGLKVKASEFKPTEFTDGQVKKQGIFKVSV